MTTTQEPDKTAAEVADEQLTGRIQSIVDALRSDDAEQAGEDFGHVVNAAQELFRRKVSMTGTKSETRDLVGEILFSRLRRAFRALHDGGPPGADIRAAEWVLGTMVGAGALGELAAAIDHAILEGGTPRDYSFAGRADFIGLEEVLQLLGGGKHRGCLSLEKDDNRLDVYFDNSHIAFLDPHHLVRRVWPGATPMEYREIPADAIADAERRHGTESVPIVISLRDRGLFKEGELREVMRQVGTEALFDFLRDRGACAYVYRRLDTLPEFARQHDFRMPVTPMLLEGNKQLDDWRVISRVFPDPDQPIEAVPDMFARISSLDLSVLEIKLLSLLGGDENSPRKIAPQVGLPLHEVYSFLIRFARHGVVVAPCRPEVLAEVLVSFGDDDDDELDSGHESLEFASALEKVLGHDDEDEDGDFGESLLRAIRDRERE